MKSLLHFVCLAAVLIMEGQVQAGVLYSQPLSSPSTSYHGYFSEGPLSNSMLSDQQIADDFSLGADASITSVEWYGFYIPGMVPSAKDFLIRFFSSSSSLPDVLLYESALNLTTGVDTGLLNMFDLPIISYTGILGTAFNANAASEYYISILENDPTTTSGWGWSFTSNAPVTHTGIAARRGAFAWTSQVGSDMAFVLNGNMNTVPPVDPPIVAVPEPSSIAIWGIGALGCCFVARRSKNKA